MKIRAFEALLLASALGSVSPAFAEPAAELSHRDRLFDVAATGESLFVVGHPGHILRSKDGGKSFEALEGGQGDQALFSIDFNTKGQGAIVGRSGMVLVSEDGGDSWAAVPVELDEERPGLFGVDVLEDGTIVTVGEFGVIARSEDRGKTFSRIPYEVGDLGDGDEEDSEEETASGSEDCPVITSFGDNADMIDQARLTDVRFIDDKVGFVVGEFGLVLRTADGGRSFERVSACTRGILYNVAVDGPNHVMAVGFGGTLIESQDAGLSWKLSPSSTEEDLYSISLYPGGAMLTGAAGAVLARQGAGEFARSESGVHTWLVSGVLDENGKGIVVGARAQILQTEDGGRTLRALGEEL